MSSWRKFKLAVDFLEKNRDVKINNSIMLVFSISLLLFSLLVNVYLYMQLKETKSQLRIEKWQAGILVDSFDH